jgi:hypothetical protein
MKKILIAGLMFCAALSLRGQTTAFASCDAITVVPTLAGQEIGACAAFNTSTYPIITMSIQAVNLSTGLSDTTATSQSQFVIQFHDCATCAWVTWPREDRQPITDIGGKARSFRIPPKTYEVRWKALTLVSGRVTAYINYGS